MTTARPVLGALAAALGLALSSGFAPAAAAPPIHERFVEEYAFTADEPCDAEGLQVEVAGTALIHRTIRVGPDGLEYFIDHLRIQETHSADGVTTTYTERSL